MDLLESIKASVHPTKILVDRFEELFELSDEQLANVISAAFFRVTPSMRRKLLGLALLDGGFECRETMLYLLDTHAEEIII
jgi:hypothetical protein